MLYHLFDYLESHYNLWGAGLMQYLTFRSALAIILALLIGTITGRKIINYLRRKQVGETVRELGLEGQSAKSGTPTMGGLIILLSILVPIVLLGDLTNVYIQLMIFATIWLGVLGFLDDYIKVFKKNKKGLNGWFKIVGQVGLGIIIGSVMCFDQNIVVADKIEHTVEFSPENNSVNNIYTYTAAHTADTTVPFFKNNTFDYSLMAEWASDEAKNTVTWVIYILMATLIITFISNCANLTDGLDGLSTGVSAIIALVLGIFAYVSGSVVYAPYLDIMYIPGSAELTVFAAAFMGALIGFLWYNSHPAQVFMGDTGSLAIGGIIAVFALLIRKELLLPLLCGVFLVEGLSVVLQVTWFKYTKWRYGEGRRVLLMSPLHHHYQKKGMAETKIVVRFWIVQILLAAMTLAILKIR